MLLHHADASRPSSHTPPPLMNSSSSNGAGSSAAAPHADAAAAAAAVRAIASLAPAALPHLVGHARLAATLHQALGALATHALLADAVSAAQHTAAVQPLVALLRRTQTQGNPSLVRALLPGTPPLLALLVAAHGSVRRPLLRRLLRHSVETREAEELLDAAAHALQAALAVSADERSTHIARAAHVVAALCAALPLPSLEGHASTLAPLLEQSYAAVKGTSSNAVRAQAHLLDAAADLRAAGGAAPSGELAKASKARTRPEAWKETLQAVRSSAQSSAAAAAAGPSEETLDALTSLLPHLQREPLRMRLAAPRYAGKGIEELTSMLLEEGDDEPPAQDLPPPSPPAPVAPAPAPAVDEGASANRARFNFDPSRLRWAGQRSSNDEGLSSELKRLTLARAEAPESDDEDDLGRELDVGFEEELEVEAPQDRRHGISTLVGPRGDARSYAAGAEDVSDDEDGALRSAPGTRPGSTAASRAATPDPRARVEEILRRAWLVNGAGAFARDERARKSAVRKDMLAQLGSGWDNALVEDWAVVFERNVSWRHAASSPQLRRADTLACRSRSAMRFSRASPCLLRLSPHALHRRPARTKTTARHASGPTADAEAVCHAAVVAAAAAGAAAEGAAVVQGAEGHPVAAEAAGTVATIGHGKRRRKQARHGHAATIARQRAVPRRLRQYEA